MVTPAATDLLSDMSLTVSKVQDPIPARPSITADGLPTVELFATKIEEAFAVVQLQHYYLV